MTQKNSTTVDSVTKVNCRAYILHTTIGDILVKFDRETASNTGLFDLLFQKLKVSQKKAEETRQDQTGIEYTLEVLTGKFQEQTYTGWGVKANYQPQSLLNP